MIKYSVIAYCKDKKKNLNIILPIVLFNKHLTMGHRSCCPAAATSLSAIISKDVPCKQQ